MTKKRVLVFFIIIVLIVAAVIGGFLGYLQLSLFEVKPIEKEALSSYVNRYGLDLLERKQDNLYQGQVPMDIIEQELTYNLIEEFTLDGADIANANIDLVKEEAKINYLVGDFFVPIRYTTAFELVDDTITILLYPESLGSSEIVLPEFFVDLFYKELMDYEPMVRIQLTDYSDDELFVFDRAVYDEDNMTVDYLLNLPDIDELIHDIQGDLNEDYVKVFKSGTEEQQEALAILEDYDNSSEEYSAKLFEDFLDEAKVIEPMLVLAKPDTLIEIFSAYPILDRKVDKSRVIEARGTLIGEAVAGYGQYLLEALKMLSSEGNLILAQDHPFDFSIMRTVTMQDLIELYEVEIPERVLKGLTMGYVDDKMQVVYASEEGPYIAINQVNYKMISEDQYNTKYNKPLPEPGTLEQEVNIYNEIYAAMAQYFGEEVFFRYLKNDQDEAYAIVSLRSNYQDFTLVAVKRVDGTFTVTQEGFANALELNRLDPEFNMNLATRMNEGVQILKLNQKTRNEVVDGLKEKGFMDSDEELIYVSYDGIQYISIVLSSWEEYIYTIYRGAFLADVYTREVAEERFGDLDPIILLHPNPNREPLTDAKEVPKV